MSQASTRSAGGRARLFAVHAEAATYKSKGLADVAVNVIAHEAEADYTDIQPGERVKRMRRIIELLQAQVTPPRQGDIVIIGGEEWALHHVAETRGGMPTLNGPDAISTVSVQSPEKANCVTTQLRQ